MILLRLSLLLTSSILGNAFSADILAVFPHTGKSHFDVYEPLVLALAARGHRLTVISFYPQKMPVANYTDINLVGLVHHRLNQLQFSHSKNGLMGYISRVRTGSQMCEKILTHRPVQQLLNSSAKFDLMLVEYFNTDCFLSLSHKYRVPYVAISSSNTSPDEDARVGVPFEPAFVSHPALPLHAHMSISEKFLNLAYSVVFLIVRAYFRAQEQRTVARLVDASVPPLGEIANQVSLVLANDHHTLLRPRPLTPAYVEIGGIHIRPAKPLPKDLEEFLDYSANGVIVFSMGSVLQSSSFPDDKRRAFMEAFAELPVRVVMKWENESMADKPDNVLITKWLPQRDMLAHPSVALFVGHGGLLSTSEAVYCGVPMVLMPMFGDQPNNVAHLTATGAAIRLPFDKITKSTVLDALNTALYDPSYRERAAQLSERYRDRPAAPLDTAVYWTEYVIRHRGAPHLRSAAVDMPWYQLWLLDVVAVLLAGVAAVLLVPVWLVRRATSLLTTSKPTNSFKKRN